MYTRRKNMTKNGLRYQDLEEYQNEFKQFDLFGLFV